MITPSSHQAPVGESCHQNDSPLIVKFEKDLRVLLYVLSCLKTIPPHLLPVVLLNMHISTPTVSFEIASKRAEF